MMHQDERENMNTHEAVYECDTCAYETTVIYDAAAHSYSAPIPGTHHMYQKRIEK